MNSKKTLIFERKNSIETKRFSTRNNSTSSCLSNSAYVFCVQWPCLTTGTSGFCCAINSPGDCADIRRPSKKEKRESIDISNEKRTFHQTKSMFFFF